MPRRRKGPPQDNIDSILLAMSRRDDIEPNTLSHYLDRLDEEWTEGAREKVLNLLRTRDLTAHSAAVMILSELATDFDLEELEDFVADPTVSDLAKLTLAPVLNELDSEMANDGIIEYLNDPEAAMLQMQTRLLELIGQSEMGVESVLEDVLSMPMERRLGFVQWLGNSQDPRAINLLLPLLENSSTKVVGATIEALEKLGPVAAPQSIPALNYLIENSSNRQLKQQARAALGRLTMHSAPGTEDAAMEQAPEQQMPLYDARASYMDGSGAQMIMIAWKRPDSLLKGVNILYEDEWGIKDCYGTDEMEPEHWSGLVSGIDEQGLGTFRVPLEYCRALIAEARAINKRTRHKLPVAYAIWRPFIESSESSTKSAPAISTILEPAPFTSEEAQLAQRGEELYAMPEFQSWMFEPLSAIQPYFSTYIGLRNSVELGQRGRKRKNAPKPEEQKARLEDLVSEVLEKVIDDKWRGLYEARLRRQGALLQAAGRISDIKLISAVAAALAPGSGQPAQDQPFLRAMMHRSLSQGLFRMMAEALEAGKFGSFPLNIFPPDEPLF